jgi:hypothetical protein
MFALIISGVTALPLVMEVNILYQLMGQGTYLGDIWPEMAAWLSIVHQGLNDVAVDYPFLFYGTDWLAFAHITIAVAFIGPLRDPVRNIWVVQFGMIACVLLVFLAMICGPVRGIPTFWILIDISFGVFGIIPLILVYRQIKRIERLGGEYKTSGYSYS